MTFSASSLLFPCSSGQDVLQSLLSMATDDDDDDNERNRIYAVTRDSRFIATRRLLFC
jgi:hypothetical protein